MLKGSLSGLRQFLANESLLKMVRNAFYFMLKVFWFLRYWHFWPDFLVMQENSSMRKLRLISKFMTSQIGQKINAIHILPNNSKSKCNQAMKSHQLINLKNKLYNISNCWSRDILNFDYFGKGFGLVSPPHFEYDFSRKMFVVFY